MDVRLISAPEDVLDTDYEKLGTNCDCCGDFLLFNEALPGNCLYVGLICHLCAWKLAHRLPVKDLAAQLGETHAKT